MDGAVAPAALEPSAQVRPAVEPAAVHAADGDGCCGESKVPVIRLLFSGVEVLTAG